MRRINRNSKLKPIIFFAVLFISLGFAAVSITLGINGTAKIAKIAYDVHFENVIVDDGSMEALIPATINEEDNTQIDFNLHFTTPGEYYEFEADIVNSGTLDAYLANVEMSGITEESKRYLDVVFKYTDGVAIEVNDLLEAGATERIKVRVEFKFDITADDLPTEGSSLDLGFDLTYNQDNKIGKKRNQHYYLALVDTYAPLDNKESEFVSRSTGIVFVSSPSDTNGKGLYVRAGTENDKYPIFYYRGGEDTDGDGVEDVLNNHVLFGGFCWRIVRTTEKGGTKLIYDGEPNESGECKNAGTTSQLTETIGFSSLDGPASVGYMYGNDFTYKTWNDEPYLYGSDITYENGEYTLKEVTTEADTITNIRKKHYTCRSATEEICNVVYYVYRVTDTSVWAMELTDGKFLEDVMNKLYRNDNSSAIKEVIDTWFKNNLTNEVDSKKKDYQNYLEDAVWCNDRTIVSGGFLPDQDATEMSYFRTYANALTYSPPPIKDTDVCSNQRDRFTKDDTTIGNGKLNYSVGLLTAEEVTIAGNRGGSELSYIQSGETFWTMSPADASAHGWDYSVFLAYNTGELGLDWITRYHGVRPAIVLKHDVEFKDGDGSISNPYVVN